MFVGLRMLTKWLAQEAMKPKYPTLDELMEGMTPSPKPAPAAQVAKEPWEMTRAEYVDGHFRSPGMHKYAVQKALSEGKPVPPEVLKNYPDLVKAAPKPSATPSVTFNRSPHTAITIVPAQSTEPIEMPTTAETKPKIGTSCIPCSVNHLSTCSGLLSEALRFARTEGLASSEVTDRLGLCQDEINAMERVDLRAENIVQLEPQERELAQELLVKTRSLRHKLEHLDNVASLEGLTAGTQNLRAEIGKKWLTNKFKSLSPEMKQAVLQKLSPPQG